MCRVAYIGMPISASRTEQPEPATIKAPGRQAGHTEQEAELCMRSRDRKLITWPDPTPPTGQHMAGWISKRSNRQREGAVACLADANPINRLPACYERACSSAGGRNLREPLRGLTAGAMFQGAARANELRGSRRIQPNSLGGHLRISRAWCCSGRLVRCRPWCCATRLPIRLTVFATCKLRPCRTLHRLPTPPAGNGGEFREGRMYVPTNAAADAGLFLWEAPPHASHLPTPDFSRVRPPGFETREGGKRNGGRSEKMKSACVRCTSSNIRGREEAWPSR